MFKNKSNNNEKTFWLDYLDCDEEHYIELKKLTDDKHNKFNKVKNKKKYENTLQNINKIQNEIRAKKTALKFKIKIRSKGMLVRHVY